MKKFLVFFFALISCCCIICFSACDFLFNNENNKEQNEDQNKVKNYLIGEHFYFDDLDIIVTDYKIENKYIWEDMFEADEGYDWAVVYLEITNQSTTTKKLEETVLFNTSRIYQTKFIYNDDYNYNSTFFTVMGTYIPDIFIRAYKSIEPLATIKGVCAFKIPENISNNGKHEFVFKFNDSSDNRACVVKLREESILTDFD